MDINATLSYTNGNTNRRGTDAVLMAQIIFSLYDDAYLRDIEAYGHK